MEQKIETEFLKKEYGIRESVIQYVEKANLKIEPLKGEYERLAEYNSYKVLNAFRSCNISARHFVGTTGYGYSDEGRDKLGELFAHIFGAESAMVSPLISSGTHAINIALFGLLRPLDTLLCITGRPYDTLATAMGLEEGGQSGTLRDFAVKYRQIDLTREEKIDLPRVMDMLALDKSVKVIYLQRSRGYELRHAFTIQEMEQAISKIRSKYPDIFIVVDNCYGEFTETREPTEVGADVIIGSLIKNPGAGIAPTGAYIAGTERAIDLIGQRLTCAGIGREIGSYLSGYLPFYQGIYFAPGVVKNALLGASLTAEVFSSLGYQVFPTNYIRRSDITQAILMKNKDELISLVRAIQKASPVDSNVVPYPWEMPGYQDQVIMASGSFIGGSSIELSADAPMKEPYVAYFQGGLTFENIKLALMIALNDLDIV